MSKKNKNKNKNMNTEHQYTQEVEREEISPTETHHVTPVVVSIGEYLKKAREKKNISLKVISQQTKINITNLENLEADQLKELPNLAYVRGYVKSLSKILELNETESLDILDSTYNLKSPKKTEPEIAPTKSASIDFPKDLMVKLALGLVGIIILVAIVSTQMSGHKETSVTEDKKEVIAQPQEEFTPQAVTAQTPLEPEMTPAINATDPVEQNAVTASTEVSKKAEEKKVEEKKVEIKKEETKPDDKDKKKRQFWPLTKELYSIETGDKRSDLLAMIPSEFRGSTVVGKQNIIILASKSDVWLTYKSDSDPIKKFVLKKGRSVLIRGDEIRIFLGNFSGATLFLNEEPLQITSSSTVKSLVFPQENRGKYKMPLFVFHDNGKVETSEDYIAREGE
ncbi:MAG: hypothetical protein Fur0010_08890 [Bdellovibrio sp.]